DLAWQRGFLTAMVNLSPTECPYEDPYRVYRAVAGAISTPPREPGMEPSRGISDVLRDLYDDLSAKLDAAGLQQWIKKNALRIPSDSHTLRRAMAEFLRSLAEDDREGELILEAWLRGDQVPRSDLRRFGLYECIDSSSAFGALRSLCQLLVGFGYPGLVLMFDEVDRNLSLSTRRIQALGDNLRQVIDLCGASMLPGVLFLYAVPPEFLRLVVPEYPALDQRLKSPLPMSFRSPQAPVIDLEHLGMEPEELLNAIGTRLLEVFQKAEGWTATDAIQQGNLQTLSRACARYSFEVGHRRLFVKTWIAFLYQQKSSGESWLGDETAEQLLSGSFAAAQGEYQDV
ncbi:MAG: BREX system ATP-binding domain-containing protein, partial [Candidatus Eremiobacterota bacterium]